MARRSSSGFTLIEILVVLVIVGIITMFALITVRGGGEARLARDELHRIERLVGLAYDESVYRAIELGMEFRATGYRFLVWDGDRWSPLPDPGVLREHRWPDGLAAALEVEARPVTLAPEFDHDDPTPQVVFLSSGEVSAFRLDLVTDERVGERLRVHVTGQAERTPLDGTMTR